MAWAQRHCYKTYLDITGVSITVTEDHINKDINEKARNNKMKEKIVGNEMDRDERLPLTTEQSPEIIEYR